MGISEERTARSQSVHVGRFRLGMPIHAAYPVVKSVDRYQQYIRRAESGTEQGSGEKGKSEFL